MYTTCYSISPSIYIRRIISRWLRRYALPFIAVLAIFSYFGVTVNPAFFIVALIFIFIIAPTILMIVYYNYALTPRIVQLSHGEVSLSIADDSVLVTITGYDRPDRQFAISIHSIKEITPGDQTDTIVYGSRPDQFILIDKNAFPSQPDRIKFHNYIFDKITKNQVNPRT